MSSDAEARRAAREARWAERDERDRLEAERKAARKSIFVTDANGTALELVPTDPMEVFTAGDGQPSIRAVDGPLYRIKLAPPEPPGRPSTVRVIPPEGWRQ